MKSLTPTKSKEYTCKYCGKEFLVTSELLSKYNYMKRERQFCSIQCANKYLTMKKTGGRPQYTKVTCSFCGKEFERLSYRPKVKHHFCCHEHYLKWSNGENHHLYNRVECTCIICGKKFPVKKSRKDNSNPITCSKECYGKYMSGFLKEYFKEHPVLNRLSGERHPQWRGGVSFEPYCPKFNNEFKERVRAFFGYRCAKCGKTQEESGRALYVHHVTYNKDTCCDASIPLFVPLCIGCHTQTNHNREYWQLHFTELIYLQYGGKCYYSQDEYAQITCSSEPITA